MKLDYLGQELAIGDWVIAANGHELAIYQIINITPKMVRIVRPEAKTRQAQKGCLRYSKELFKVDSEIVTFHILRTK